jgi:hypothetical protein
MATKLRLAVLLFCAWNSAQAGDKKIPISTLPIQIRTAIDYFAPGAQLIEARVSPDKEHTKVYDCTYFRNIHLGTIKLGADRELFEIDEELVMDDLPPVVRKKVLSETKGGLIKKIKLEALYGQEVYRIKAYCAKSTNIEVSLVLTRTGRIVERKASQGLLIFATAPFSSSFYSLLR